MRKTILFIIFIITHFTVFTQKVAEPTNNNHPEWSDPYPPFRIAGNLYYVGTDDLACYLIVTDKGSILINTGLASSALMIKKNIEALGFKFGDIKILLTNQAHFDHMGAMAAIKKLTRAKFMVDAGDAAVVADGGRSDYAMGGPVSTYAPVKIDRILHNGDTIKLGSMQLVMLHHPGHSKGACSFVFNVRDNKRQYRVLIANMPSIPTDKKFSALTSYPTIAHDYAYTFAAMRKLTFDIWLASHATQFDLHKKHPPGTGYNPEAFIDRKGYDAELNDLYKQFTERLTND